MSISISIIKEPDSVFPLNCKILCNGQEVHATRLEVLVEPGMSIPRVLLELMDVELEMKDLDGEMFTTIGGVRYRLVDEKKFIVEDIRTVDNAG